EAPVRAARLQAAWTLDFGEAEEIREGLAPDQGAGRLGVQGSRGAAAGIRTVRAHGGGPRCGPRSRRGHPARAHTARRAATSGRGEVGRPYARRDGGAGVLAGGLVVRAQARRLPGAGRAGPE